MTIANRGEEKGGGKKNKRIMKIVVINVVASRKHRPPGMSTARANPFLILHNRNQKLAAITVIQVEKHIKPSSSCRDVLHCSQLTTTIFKQPFCDYFGHDQYVLEKIVLPFQSRLELDNKPDHDAIKDLVAGGV